MTAAGWDACRDPLRMLGYLSRCKPPRASDRKLRLFAAACCRRVAHLLPDPRLIDVLEKLERMPDEATAVKAYFRVQDEAYKILRDYLTLHGPAHYSGVAVAYATNHVAHDAAFGAAAQASFTTKRAQTERTAQSRLLEDIVGNPLRPVAVESAWRSSTVVALAQGIYAEKAFDRLPILADALQDAGCDSEDVLAHCRDPKGVHARGCWLIDRVLGKE
jgi:hypothetical protein